MAKVIINESDDSVRIKISNFIEVNTSWATEEQKQAIIKTLTENREKLPFLKKVIYNAQDKLNNLLQSWIDKLEKKQ
jgi:hypothetical protein